MSQDGGYSMHSRMSAKSQQPGGILMYAQDGTPVIVDGDGVAVRGLLDFNPATNRWAAKDLILHFFKVAIKRPLPTAGVTILAFFSILILANFAAGLVLTLAGRSRPVALSEIQKDSASQVGYWLGSSIAAPTIQNGSIMLVDFVDVAAQQNATLVNFRTGNSAQYPLAPANGVALPADTPLMQVIDGGRR